MTRKTTYECNFCGWTICPDPDATAGERNGTGIKITNLGLQYVKLAEAVDHLCQSCGSQIHAIEGGLA